MSLLRRIGRGLVAAAVLLVLVACTQYVRNSGEQPLPPNGDGVLRVATYNVHYIDMRQATGPWSLADWQRRKGPLDLAFKAIDADVIAFQEMESFAGGSESRENLTLDWLLENNPGYAAAAVGDPSEFPSTQPILYRTSRLQMLDQGWFFFSETPDVIYSRTFDGSYPAFASWATFRSAAGAFRLVNVHTDFRSLSNREQSLHLVAERIAPWIAAGETVFVAGDLNGRLGSDLLGIVEAAGIRFVPVEGASYHFNRGLNLFAAIDHIGVSDGAVLSGEPVILREKFDGEWPADHYPVIADFRLE